MTSASSKTWSPGMTFTSEATKIAVSVNMNTDFRVIWVADFKFEEKLILCDFFEAVIAFEATKMAVSGLI